MIIFEMKTKQKKKKFSFFFKPHKFMQCTEGNIFEWFDNLEREREREIEKERVEYQHTQTHTEIK